jgi:hypothetical protein
MAFQPKKKAQYALFDEKVPLAVHFLVNVSAAALRFVLLIAFQAHDCLVDEEDYSSLFPGNAPCAW